MSRQVPPSSKARSRKRVMSDADRAFQRYRNFTGDDVRQSERISVPALPKSAACVGVVDSIAYTTVRDGKTQSFIHEFIPQDAPLLCVSPDGKQILLLKGNYTFTYRGIVDKSYRD